MAAWAGECWSMVQVEDGTGHFCSPAEEVLNFPLSLFIVCPGDCFLYDGKFLTHTVIITVVISLTFPIRTRYR
jgi:hypothetical protein